MDARKLESEMKPYISYAENIDGMAWDQFCDAMKQDFVIRGALMPDAHAGYSLPIGGVVATKGVIVPAWVGYDIGCGMCAQKTTYDRQAVEENAQMIFDDIYKAVPVGFKHNTEETQWDQPLGKTRVMHEIFETNGRLQLGSLGGGNHFIEVGYDEDDSVWVVIHSGSRGIGHKTATYYMRRASFIHTGVEKAKEGHYGLATSSEDGLDYATDMNFCLEFALKNRKEMMRRVMDVLARYAHKGGATIDGGLINRNHNHAEFKDGLWIHRKGATHAEEGMMGVIPGNMRDGSFIVEGKGCVAALWSSSHGAGRVLGRKAAKEVLNVEDFRDTMEGITALVGEKTLDESPMAYKNIFDVMAMQSDLVTVKNHIKPLINIKG